MTIIWKYINEKPGHISAGQIAFKYFHRNTENSWVYLKKSFCFVLFCFRYWLKLRRAPGLTKPGHSALALLFAAFNHRKSEPAKAEFSITGDITALGVACVCGLGGTAPHNQAVHEVSAERLKTREASVKQ